MRLAGWRGWLAEGGPAGAAAGPQAERARGAASTQRLAGQRVAGLPHRTLRGRSTMCPANVSDTKAYPH